MIGSLIISKQVNGYYDEIEKGVSDSTIAASMVVKSVESLTLVQKNQIQAQSKFYNDMTTRINMIEKTITDLGSSQVDKEQINGLQNQIMKAQSLLQKGIDKQIIPNLNKAQANTEQVAKMVPDVQRLNSNIGELLGISSAMPSQLNEMSEKVTKLTDKLHSEVLEIEDAMNQTNHLLELKFNEFTELLKKSNTEALVEVMKKVTEEFQKQMGVLINKLVQENFDQLNKSVAQLNTWQIENKEMITSLTKQYKQMADNFDATSVTLTNVSGDTELLVSEGGKLRQIIDALNKVLIEDTKFVEVSSKLAETADLTKDNMLKFDESTKSLNDWVRKQRSFVEGVTLLINKLDEINKINDYSEEFWKETKKGLNEAVGTIRGSINALNNEIGELDEHFYQRLNATLSELDTCMQAMIQGRR